MEKHYFTTPRTARYYLLGNTNNPTKLWIALHGYGQQGKYWSSKLKSLEDEDTLVLIPEGLNRYYLQGYNGRVGATWMTSDDRQADIEDNSKFLEELTQTIFDKYPTIIKYNILAFSQGIATACRWYVASKFDANKLVLWAGSLANDIKYSDYAERLNKSKIFYVFGDRDEFFDAPKILMNETLLLNSNVDYQLVSFEGKHIIDSKLLKQLANDN